MIKSNRIAASAPSMISRPIGRFCYQSKFDCILILDEFIVWHSIGTKLEVFSQTVEKTLNSC